MCGRFLGPNPLTALAKLGAVLSGDWTPTVTINYNAAPTQEHLAIVQRDRRVGVAMQWGWRPAFMRGGLLVNGHAETAASKPTFADAFCARRCVIPAGGFYEWKAIGKAKLPFLFRVRGQEVVGLAALWQDEPDGERTRRRFVLLTTRPNELVAPVHDRMAVLLTGDAVGRWLDPVASPAALAAVCEPYQAAAMEAVAVSPLLNKVANSGPEVLAAPESRAG